MHKLNDYRRSLSPRNIVTIQAIAVHLQNHGPDTLLGISQTINCWYIDCLKTMGANGDLFERINPNSSINEAIFKLKGGI